MSQSQQRNSLTNSLYHPSLLEDLLCYILCPQEGWIYAGPLISFQTYFLQWFKIVADTWKFIMLLLYILWSDLKKIMVSGLNEQLQQQYTLLKPNCHGWWSFKMKSGREDTLKERYAIKFCLKLGKMPQKRIEYFRRLLEHLAWIEHQFLSGIRESRKAGSLWGRMRGVGGVSQYTKFDYKELGLLWWGF